MLVAKSGPHRDRYVGLQSAQRFNLSAWLESLLRARAVPAVRTEACQRTLAPV